MSSMTLGNNKATNRALDALKRPSVPTKKLQMNVPEDLHKAFKLACLKEDRDMTDVTVTLIEQWIAGRGIEQWIAGKGKTEQG